MKVKAGWEGTRFEKETKYEDKIRNVSRDDCK